MTGHAWTVASDKESGSVREATVTVLPVSTHPSLRREGQHTRDSDNLQMEPGPLQLFTTGG